MGVLKWYMQMPVWGSESLEVSVSLELDPACSHWERPAGAAAHSGTWLSASGWEAKEVISWVLKITQRGMVKLGVNIAVCLCFCLSVSFLQRFDPFWKNKKTYISFKSSAVVLLSLWVYKEGCSSHNKRFIFSRESMPPSSNSATHWPINGESTLIPSVL